MLKSLLAVFIGGGVGSSLRLLFSRYFFATSFGHQHAWLPIALINIIGSFVIGVLYVLLVKHYAFNELWRNLLMVGLLGGFTTFSSFSLNVLVSAELGNFLGALSCVFVSVFGGIFACAIGIYLTKIGLA